LKHWRRLRTKIAAGCINNKNETENLMNEAIGSQISDYLINRNPNQYAESEKIIDTKIGSGETTTAYQQQFAIYLCAQQ